WRSRRREFAPSSSRRRAQPVEEGRDEARAIHAHRDSTIRRAGRSTRFTLRTDGETHGFAHDEAWIDGHAHRERIVQRDPKDDVVAQPAKAVRRERPDALGDGTRAPGER